MNRVIAIMVSALLFAACHKGDASIENAYLLKQNPAWETEKFKNDYTIQFPPGSEGGVTGFEGNVFDKHDNTDYIFLTYNYCDSLHCNDFGDTLENIYQPTIQGLFHFKRDTILLNQRVNFTKNDAIVGIYYYSADSVSYGKLFWKDDGVFKEAANVEYNKENKDEVIEIIGTMKIISYSI